MIDQGPTKCQSLLSYLSDFMDGELSPDLCEQIENHLAECHDCTVVVDTLRKTISLYHTSAANPEELPGVVRERLFRTLHLDDFTHP